MRAMLNTVKPEATTLKIIYYLRKIFEKRFSFVHHHDEAMIQRTIFRQSRAAGASLRVSHRVPLARSQNWHGNVSLARTFQPARRWYATEPEPKKSTEGESEITGKSQTEAAQAEDPLKKEVEAKNREIIELKVRRYPDP